MPTNAAAESTGPDRTAVRVTVTGTVQGVGFRPFVARIAADHGLAGRVRNTDSGVLTRLEGPPSAVDRAVEAIRTDPPRLARIDGVSVERADCRGDASFRIEDSTGGDERAALVPPDTAVCASCLDDVRDPDSRFEGYWATACVECGPRFSITRGLPYDRAETALAAFEPCPDCEAAYRDRTDRRFHAQTIACPVCGPTLSLIDDGERAATGAAAIEAAAERLNRGAIVGIKGAGGTHLACRARDHGAVGRLRERLARPAKPFATMARSVESAGSFATLRDPGLLSDERRPIALLPKAGGEWLERVSPGLGTVGVMLPHSGLHHLLFDAVDSGPLVMTSANRPGAPMATTTEELLELGDVLDAALVHDRAIENRCDDSVVKPLADGSRVLRRSRGYVPRPLDRPVVPDGDREVLAVGAGSDVTVAATRGDAVVLSQHVGDVSGPETAAWHRRASAGALDLLGVEPSVVARDMHPDVETTRMAEARPEPTVAVQHHHAHAASLLAERGRERAVVIAADGTGYGPEGIVRGGEVLDAGLDGYERVGGLSRFRLPGGERAVHEPPRVAAALLAESDPKLARSLLLESETVGSEAAADAVLEQATGGPNSPPTTSAGRFLDAVAALCGVCTERRYRGEPAMRLEAAAEAGEPLGLDPPVRSRGETRVLDACEAGAALADRLEGHPEADVAATAQRLLADGLAAIAIDAATERGLGAVGFTGGVAYNAAIDRRVRERIERAGLTYLAHDRVPPGDGGLSYGQAVVASARLAAGTAEGG